MSEAQVRMSGPPFNPLIGAYSMMRRFVALESAGGILLLICTVLALIAANGPLAQYYEAFWATAIGVNVGPFALEKSLLHWINDGLMAIFFFVVTLELKREISVGEMSGPGQFALPTMAAFGGSIVPAAIYAAFTWGTPGISGWGIPMATDIAFALCILMLLGSRIKRSLILFVLGFTIMDDMIAIAVIAFFYSSTLNFKAMAVAAGILAVLAILSKRRFYHPFLFLALGAGLWLSFLHAGLHTTLAGVLMATFIPIEIPLSPQRLKRKMARFLDSFGGVNSEERLPKIDEAKRAITSPLNDGQTFAISPLLKYEHFWQPWMSFCILPVFALANAGVQLSGDSDFFGPISLGVTLALVFGKPIGIVGTVWLGTKLRLVPMPTGATWKEMIGIGCVAGVGFTMALFIAALGISDPADLNMAKGGVLMGSLISAVLAVTILLLVTKKAEQPQETPRETQQPVGSF